MPEISFEKQVKTSRFHHPLKDFELAEIRSEIRRDPLTGRTGRVCHFQTRSPEQTDYENMARETRESFCPFCPEHVTEYTPTFPSEFIPEGRLQNEAAVLFPNLAPYDGHSCVAVFTEKHYVPMNEVEGNTLRAGLSLAQDFMERVQGHDQQDYFPLVNWNYMPLSGGSQLHPHLQVVATTTPGQTLRDKRRCAREYWQDRGTNFWVDLCREEKTRGERFLGERAGIHWLVPFVPTSVLGDVMAVFPPDRTFAELSGNQWKSFCSILLELLQQFHEMGVRSFNLGFFSEPRDCSTPGFSTHARLVPRYSLSPETGSPEWGSIQVLYGDTFSIRTPEHLAQDLRERF